MVDGMDQVRVNDAIKKDEGKAIVAQVTRRLKADLEELAGEAELLIS